ncbi:hypothetical protein JL722_2907 [Aureococcus anophagefferens]|nr:hypothetical protein JL722_2907 [Aureococcus anophagefferens]
MTPMERQIQGLLDSHRGCLLVMEVGYKYRVFGPGAEEAAKALGLVAWRDKHFITCSFPTGRLAVHVRRLVRAGFRVAVARQTDTAALKAAGATASGKSGTFDRAVDRVFSASTLIFDDVEDELGGGGGDSEGDDAAATTAAALPRWLVVGADVGGAAGLAAVDLRAGAVALARVDCAGDAASFLAAPPAECLQRRRRAGPSPRRSARRPAAPSTCAATRGALDAGAWAPSVVAAAGNSPALRAALRSAAAFCGEMGVAGALRRAEAVESGAGEPMRLDAATLTDLEVLEASDGRVEGSASPRPQSGAARRSSGTGSGRRSATSAPCARQAAVASAGDVDDASPWRPLDAVVALAVDGAATGTRHAQKALAALGSGRIRPRHLASLLRAALRRLGKPRLEWKHVRSGSTTLEYLVELKKRDAEGLEAREDRAKAWFVARDQDLRRYVAPAVGDLVDALRVARERAKLAARAAFGAVAADADARLSAPLSGARLAASDALRALGALAREPGWVLPDLGGPAGKLALRGLRHPTLVAEGGACVANDVELRAGDALVLTCVLTGPNAGGKSSIARAVALAHVFAQAGGPVPCERADIPLRDAIFTRMGAADDLAAGASTFLAELRRAALPLNEATAASFVRATTLFITHYHDLAKAAAADHARVRNVHVAYARVPRDDANDGFDDDIVMLYKLEPGLADASFGIYAARAAGVPPAVLDLARAKVGELRGAK